MTFDQSQNESGHAQTLPDGEQPVPEGRSPGISGVVAQPGAPPDGAKKRAAGDLGRWGAGKASQSLPIQPMTTQGLPTVVPFDKRHDFGSSLAFPGSQSGDPKRHRLPF